MKIGYIIGDEHPLLQTIASVEINKFQGNKPILIVGVKKAFELYPNIKLDSKTIDREKLIFYCFSKEESEEKYNENLKNFIDNCFETLFSAWEIININNLKEIKEISKTVFVYETETILTITTINKIYYINKEIYNFINNVHISSILIKSILLAIDQNIQLIAWDKFNYFGAYLKCFNDYHELDYLNKMYKQFKAFNLFIGALCLKWLNDLEKTNKIDLYEFLTWQRAYSIEEALSHVKIKVNDEILKNYASIETNTTMQTIYANVVNGYVKQKYNGTNKITGRIYVKNSEFSLQTLPQKFKDIIIAEPNCILVEIDYNYFEFALLSQLSDLKIDGDPHFHLSQEIFGDKEHRSIAKTINYGLLYGQSLKGILKNIYENHKDIKLSQEDLENKLKEILSYLEPLKKKLEFEYNKNGCIKNHFMRSIYPEKSFALLNNYIQSTAADFIIIKLEKFFQLFEQYNSLNKIILQNHDSILFNLRSEDVDNTDIVDKINEILLESENNLKASYKLNYGLNWKDLN